ncbi:MAG: SDR family oxidoreductase [Terracidiphilus sp.]|nr:SDR family oxidoreductase [Terracidiphilus sp.]MDR3798861.1 SDR family oxidoreductase [Terracidiphilus sp.]
MTEKDTASPESPFTLSGKTAIVTGGGRGIGRAIVQRLVSAGANVLAADLDQEALQETQSSVHNPERVALVCGDLMQPALPQEIVNAALEAFDAIDIIVNCAGFSWDSVIQKTSDEQFLAMLNIHIVAPFRLLRAASDYLRATAKHEIAAGQRVMRKVVNITSISGTGGNAGQAGYSAGKSGVIGLTKTLAKEWGRYNVNVNAVGFGLIQTRMTQPLTPEAKIEMAGREIPIGVQPAMLDSIAAACPLGRIGTPEEAAGAVLFFCSPLSDYVTGEVLICSGGYHF